MICNKHEHEFLITVKTEQFVKKEPYDEFVAVLFGTVYNLGDNHFRYT